MQLSGKNVLVTGAGGFIGSHLTETLLDRGCHVRAFIRYNSINSWGWLDTLDKKNKTNLEIYLGDIRDQRSVNTACENIDVIFHLAALIAIPYSYLAPDSYIDTNVKGTLNICKAAQENQIKKVIITSTSEVYGTAQYVPIDEKHPKQPQSPYSASKIGADALALSFYNSFNVPLVIARPFNTFGPRQSARAVIPTIITQIANGIKEIKLGDLSPTRDYNFVKDTCKGFCALAQFDSVIGQEINISSNYEISVRDVLKSIVSIMKSDVTILEDEQRVRPANSEVFRLWGDNTKIKNLTGYKPDYDFRKGLEETVQWFCNPLNLQKYKANIYNV
jgi:NAD dependent epimerase/dehydratase